MRKKCKIAPSLAKHLVPIESLREDLKNANKHDARSIDVIAASLEKFGQRVLLVARRGVVIKGNGTLRAAKKLGWTHVACSSADDLGEKEARAFAIADNRAAQFSEWDIDVLGDSLAEIGEILDAKTFAFDEVLSKRENASAEDVMSKLDVALRFEIAIECESEKDQVELIERLEREGRKCRPLIL